MSATYDGLIPVHSTDYPTWGVDYPFPAPANEVQTIEVNTLLTYDAYWAELFFLNRSAEVVAMQVQREAPAFAVPPQAVVRREGWGSWFKITSGAGGFGPASDLVLTLARREMVVLGQ